MRGLGVRGIGELHRPMPTCIAEPQDGELSPSNPGSPQRQESTLTSDQGTETSLQTMYRRRKQGKLSLRPRSPEADGGARAKRMMERL